MILLPQKVAYRGSVSGLRISSVDGTAFLDNCAALVPYADGLHRVEIYDSAGRQLVGYLSAQGSGETLGEDLLGGTGDFSSNVGWTTEENWAIGGGVLTGTATGSSTYRVTAGLSAGSLYKIFFTLGGGSSGDIHCWLGGDGATFAGQSGDGAKTDYSTRIANSDRKFYIARQTTNFTGTFDDASVKQVLTPSTDGCTIVSTKSGAVPNFAYKNTSFTYNAATHYVVVRKAR